MISNNIVPEKVAECSAYLNGKTMVGTVPEIDIPEIAQKSTILTGLGISGDIDSPTVGLFESIEQTISFNTLYSSYQDMLLPNKEVDITFRAAQQCFNKEGGYVFKGCKIVERGRIKKFKPGKLTKGESMEASITIELTYLYIESDDVVLTEIDKINGKFISGGEDMLEEIKKLVPVSI